MIPKTLSISILFCVAMMLFLGSFGQTSNDTVRSVSVEQHSAMDSLFLAGVLAKTDSIIHLDENSNVAKTMVNTLFELSVKDSIANTLIAMIGRKGVENRKKFKLNNAIFWHERQEEFAIKTSNQLQIINAYNNLGLIYRRMDSYSKSIQFYQEALRLSDSLQYKLGSVYATNGLGNIYLSLGNYDEAMRSFRDCLSVEQAMNNLNGVAINLNNIGHVYMNQNDLDRALEYFMLSMEVNREINSQQGVAISYNDIGEVFLRKGNAAKAMNYFLHSLQLNKSENEFYYLAINEIKVAELYLEARDYAKAEPYVADAIKNALQTNNRSALKDAYKFMYQIQRKKGNTDVAIDFLEKSTILNDSILNENIQKTVFQMQAAFGREQADDKITLLQKENELADLRIKKQELNNYLVFSILGFLILVIVMLTLSISSVAKRNKLLRSKNQEIEEAQSKLHLYTEQLLAAKQEAERNNKLKSQFLANISHEIRTPMNSIIGFSDILSRAIEDTQHLSYLQAIRSSGQSLLVLINDILDLSKIESGKIDIEHQPLDITLLINEIKLVFEPLYSQKNLDLIVEMDEQLPRTLLFSEVYLRQILFNVIGNAIKFTEKGSVVLKTEIDLVSHQSISLRIIVADSGSGMDEKELTHIFDAFYQSESTKSKKSGTGLGLTITKRLTNALGGNIAVTSKLGQGTTFYISFPSIDFIPERTNFRFITAKSEQYLFQSQLCLLSNDLDIKSNIDQCLNELKLTCEVYPKFELLALRLNNSQPKVLLIIDAAEFQKLELQTEPLNQLKRLGLPLLLVFKSDFPIETLDMSMFTQHFMLPEAKDSFIIFLRDQSKSIKNKAEEKPVEKLWLDVNDEAAQQVVLMYFKASESQFIRDAAEFADALQQFAQFKRHETLLKLSEKLIKSLEVFDIEKIIHYLERFSEMTNAEMFFKENQPFHPNQLQ